MSLAKSMEAFKAESAAAASRNSAYARPTSTAPARTSTPQPSGIKRTRDDTSAPPPSTAPSAPLATGGAGREVMSNVVTAVGYLKERFPSSYAFDEIIRYLSLDVDGQRRVPLIKRAMIGHTELEHIPKGSFGAVKESFKYRPKHPVTNEDELADYLARQPTFQGIQAKELKDGFPSAFEAIDRMEKEHRILVTRHKKDNTPKMVWADQTTFHQHVDSDFVDFWAKTKLPATETEIRSELEKAGLTPTSQVKETIKKGPLRKDRRRINRRGGKVTNTHMKNILKDYQKR